VPVELASLVRPAHTAVVVQEVQEGVVGAGAGLPALAAAADEVGMVPAIARLLAAGRAAGVRVIHATAETLPDGFGANRNARLFAGARRAGVLTAAGADAVRPVAGLGVADGDLVLPRYFGLSPLGAGPLDGLLRNEGVTTLVVVGVSLNIAIPHLVFEAVSRSYQVVLPTDAVVGVPVAYGEAVVANSLALVATRTTTDELTAIWAHP
jgi:biuret amidohydrolase